MQTNHPPTAASSLERARSWLLRLWPEDAAERGPRLPSSIVLPLVLLAATLGTVARLGWRVSMDTIWAEDGRVFLSQAVEQSTWEAVTAPYAGYLHLVPRLLTEPATLLPVSAAPATFTSMATLATAGVALVVYRAVRPHVHSPELRLALALYVALLPVGREVVGNVANLHWYLLFAAFCVLLWDARSRAGVTLTVVILVGTALSDPFVVVLLPLVLLRLLVVPAARSWVVAGSTLLATAVQGLAVVQAPSRTMQPELNPAQLGVWYVSRVLSAGLWGEELSGSDGPVSLRNLGLGAIAGIVVIVMAMAARRGSSRVVPAACACLAWSLLLFVVPVGLSGVATGRYAVAPSSLLVLALVMVVDGLRHGQPGGSGPRRLVQSVAAVVVIGWVVALPAGALRDVRPGWQDATREAASDCTDGRDLAVVPIAPTGWDMEISCAYLDQDG